MAVSARFWRLALHQITGNGGSVGLTEWFLALTSGGAQAATGGTAWASSSLGSWAPVSILFNNATGSGTANHWFSAAATFSTSSPFDGSVTIQYDMGAGNTLAPVEMRLAYDNTNGLHRPATFTLWYSDDGFRWSFHSVWIGETWTGNPETKTYNITTPMSAPLNILLPSLETYRNIEASPNGPNTQFGILPGVLASHRSFTRIPRWTQLAGPGYIAGSTTVLGDPARRQVDLIDQMTGGLYDRAYTGPDGQFRFEHLGPGPWLLLGTDVTGNQNSVVFAHMTTEPMP